MNANKVCGNLASFVNCSTALLYLYILNENLINKFEGREGRRPRNVIVFLLKIVRGVQSNGIVEKACSQFNQHIRSTFFVQNFGSKNHKPKCN